MGSRGAVAGRVRWIVVFTVLLLVSSAVPVFAADAPDEQLPEEARVDAPVESGPVKAPDEGQVQEGIEAAERAEAARKHELQTPDLTRQREESRYAFAGLSDSDAQQLLLTVFSAQMASLNADPARYLSDVEVLRTYGESAATVSAEGDGSLLEAGIPVRTENAEGDLEKVDLSLQATDTGFEPVNSLAELRIPDSADEAIEIGEEGLAISSVGAEGESKAQTLGDKNVWFSEAQTDTDLLVSPTASGVELFDQLRSADSPETLRFQLDLPEGAELRGNGSGGAEISKDGKVFAAVSPPSAVDAQGTPVPVELQAEGSAITVHVPHREGDFAYPILLDPAISENYEGTWYWGSNLDSLNLSIWGYNTNDPTELYILHNFYCLTGALCSPSGRGLFISTLNRNIPANIYAQWYYSVPGSTTYIPSIYPEPSASINGFHRSNEGCTWNQYPQPHDYDGSFDAGGNWQWFETDRAQWYGTATMYTKAKGIAFGMSSGGGVNIPCWRDIMVGGVAVRLDDPEAPTLSSVSGIPSGWVSDATPFSIGTSMSDPGLGVQNVIVSPEGDNPFLFTPEQNQCPGTKTHPCPASTTAQHNVNGDLFDEGEKGVKVSVRDPTGKISNTYQGTTRVDKTPPEVVLGGQLAVATDETEGDAKDPEKWDELRLPVYNLRIEATDGSLQSGATKRSGVKSIEVFLDSKETPEKTWTQTCPGSSCSMTQTYTLKLNELSADVHHTLRVITKDQVNKERKREIEFEYIPATGMKDEYVMQYFPLPDGQGNEAEEEHPNRPELAVNVMNGNLVYRQKDIEVPGAVVDLEVERYYNSLLPEAENTEWGDGWTLAQTPKLEPEAAENPPSKATMVRASGVVQSSVGLPAETNGERFDPKLQALVTKEPGGGYEVADESGETDTALAFDQSGKVAELRTPGYAKVDYDYEAGKLSEIAVVDPASTSYTPEELPPPVEPHPIPTYTSSFGSSGTGNGQFAHPAGVAVDPKGNIWVVDENHYRVEKFNEAGEYQSSFGSLGTGNGQFSRPTDVAIDAKGNLWVTDAGNNRVEEFNEKGEYVTKFGSSGSGNGQFSGPEAIAIDAKGNIWIGDTYHGRLQEFNEKGEFIKVVGSSGSGQGQMIEPTGVAIGPGGNVWVADWGNNRVTEFSEAGTFVRQFGTEGTGNGQFKRPDVIEVDTAGDVWVGDQNNNRIQEFNQSGEYVTQFGSAGSGSGQFSFGWPMGIASDSKGRLWIADTGNNRVQRWTIPNYVPTYTSAFGAAGAGNGQFSHPADVARDAEGNVWVVDKGNNRIEKFNEKGEYLSKFGSTGSGNGQLSAPRAIAIDTTGNIWVADGGNNRMEEFNEAGEYLAKFGSSGTGNGQFSTPEGIAIDPKGNIWVADTYHGRLQKFNEKGEFIKVVGSYGSGAGQIGEPTGIDIGPGGNVWVADWQNNRVAEFNEAGEFVRQFGSSGTGNGQFNRPDAIDVDAKGNVWVGDQNNGRVEEFNQAGEYVTQFGTKGSGTGQFSFSYPLGVTTDSKGNIWVADTNNNRVQRWLTTVQDQEAEALLAFEDDPTVDVNVSGGLVASVKGAEAGQHTYSHSGALLTAHAGPQGETKYEYDSTGRMTKVTLPNGTSGSIAYFTADGRVKSVTVDPAGADPAKTTYFEYSDEPRRTTVIPPDTPHVTYDIGADGSVLKWWNTLQPPTLDDVSGSLYANKETASPISIGDHNLVAQSHSEEGIASIQFIANGNILVDEMTCEQDPEKAGLECLTVLNEWVTETGALSPGILNLEVITTDRLGQTGSERFWVNIPYTPPEPPGAISAPKFKDIKQFREEYGLEVVFPVANELELDDRIFDLIGAWHNPQTPEGEVARASWERWGVPMRAADVAEIEYREWFNDVNGERIDRWVEESAPSNFAGYYMDHKAGGIMHIGFTENQAVELESLKATLPLVAEERLQVYPTAPTTPYLSLEATSDSIGSAIESNATLRGLVTSLTIGESDNVIYVGALDVAQVQSILNGMFGSTSSIVVGYLPRGEHLTGRFRNSGRMRAGDSILNANIARCTAGFGAYDKFNVAGKDVLAIFVLTAGHCYGLDELVLRSPHSDSSGSEDWRRVGFVKRRSYGRPEPMNTDAEAIRITEDGIVPLGIFGWGGNLIPTGPATKARVGNRVCFSGAHTQVPSCGEIVAREKDFEADGVTSGGYLVEFETPADHGDSGAPVWNARTGASIGLVTGGNKRGQTLVEPLLHPPRMNDDLIPGILHDKWLQPLQLKLGG